MVSDTFSIVRDTFLWLQIQFSADSDSVSNDDVYDSSHADWNARGLLCDGKAACFFLSVTCFPSIPHFSGPRRFFLCDYLYFCPLNSILKQEKWS